MRKMGLEGTYGRALRWIDACAREKETVLDLSDRGLTVLPPEIGQLTTLTQLNLSNNLLKALPTEIGELRALTKLDLGKNRLQMLPAEIGELRALTQLSLGNNRILTLPAAIGNPAALTKLDLAGNRLTALPPEISKLSALTKLDLAGNQLAALPREIGQLTALTQLRLNENQLAALPKELGDLTMLTEFGVSGNKLTVLPPEIGNLTALVMLAILGNQLTTLPPEISNLTSLTNLDVAGNQLTALPPEVGNLAALTSLDVAGNRLTALPPEIGNLTALTQLRLVGNRLTALPPEIGNLTALMEFRLVANQLTALPPEIGNMMALTNLDVAGNQLRALPPEIGKLRTLTELCASDNRLTVLPPEIGGLTALTELRLAGNRLAALPPEIGNMTALTTLDVAANELTVLPPEIAKLASLAYLDVGRNPLQDPGSDIVGQGQDAILRYLRAKLRARRVLWECKALIIGEGDVGKTWLYEALHGCLAGGSRERGATVGIEIGRLELEHPERPDVMMRLQCWDFAGQEQNYATHQFFFHEDALILLVWNLRAGHEAGRLRKWLGNLRDRAPRAKLILVGTQCDQPHADYPEKDLRREFPQIVETFKVSNVTGENIDVLREAIRRHAATVSTMGQEWPEAWWKGAEELAEVGKTCKQVTLAKAEHILANNGVSKGDAKILLRWLHALGRVVHYADSADLRDIVILDPQWLTRCIGLVLASHEVADRKGILRREHLNQLWADLDEQTRQRLVAVMNRFDLAYEIPDDPEDRCVVVEKLPQNSAAYEEQWDKSSDRPQVRLRYQLTELHPGIPSWFIARNHRFTQDKHWLRGVLFGHPRKDPSSVALVQADEARRTVEFAVRGLLPQGFLSILTDSFEDTVTRLYPGMQWQRVVPCPTPGCTGSVALADLEGLLDKHRARKRKSSCWECPTCQAEHEIEVLLVGLTRVPGHLVMAEKTIERIIDVVRDEGRETREHMTREMAEARLWLQNLFINEWNQAQLNVDLSCPSVFAFYPLSGRGLLYERTFCLQLYCMCPEAWHGVGSDGLVEFRPAKEWWAKTANGIQKVARWVRPVATLLPLLGNVAGETIKAAGEWAAEAKNELDLTAKFCEQLDKVDFPENWGLADRNTDGHVNDWSNERSLRELKAALEDLSFPVRPYGGLVRHRTRDNKVLWLCEKHAKEMSAE